VFHHPESVAHEVVPVITEKGAETKGEPPKPLGIVRTKLSEVTAAFARVGVGSRDTNVCICPK
jgi:hypothetical protein